MCEDGLHDPFTDQVECARFKAERDALAQRMEEVASEIDRTLSGVEGIEDAPAMRWARGLREALGALHSPRTSYEDIEAARWVREHGGLDAVKAEWRSRVPYDLYERRRQRLLDHIAECETALGRRREIISELTHRVSDLTTENTELRRRAMPEGCEWPTVDGRKVDFKTPYQPSLGVLEAVSIYNNGACEVMSHDGIIKPVSEIHVVVLAADGEPLEVGQTVWHVNNGIEFTVVRLPKPSEYQAVKLRLDDGAFTGLDPDQLTHQRPAPAVLASDGEMLLRDETVYNVVDGEEYRVRGFVDGVLDVCVETADGDVMTLCHDVLTHARSEIDTWERLENDTVKTYTEYWKCEGVACSSCPALRDGKKPWERFGCDHNCIIAMKRDLVRRAKKLAGVDND